jgi:hypothetical protein
VDPALFAIPSYKAQYDSWLTVGITEGDTSGALGTIGIPFDTWTADQGLENDDCAVFWMDPSAGPDASAPIVVGQLTVANGVSFAATIAMQGRSKASNLGNAANSDWRAVGIVFEVVAAVPAPEPDGGSGESGGVVLVSPDVVVIETDGVEGYTTYRLQVSLGGNAANAYTIFGMEDSPLRMPPAFQETSPFAADVGGVAPALFAIPSYKAQYDSWLTVGITEGDTSGALGSIGIPFDTWTADQGMENDDCAVFWMDPSAGPDASAPIVVGQLTVMTGQSFMATAAMQG